MLLAGVRMSHPLIVVKLLVGFAVVMVTSVLGGEKGWYTMKGSIVGVEAPGRVGTNFISWYVLGT